MVDSQAHGVAVQMVRFTIGPECRTSREVLAVQMQWVGKLRYLCRTRYCVAAEMPPIPAVTTISLHEEADCLRSIDDVLCRSSVE